MFYCLNKKHSETVESKPEVKLVNMEDHVIEQLASDGKYCCYQ
jgi:hypothetical protein